MFRKGLIILSVILFVTVQAAGESRQVVVTRLFKAIESWIGTPYVLGGYSKEGIDCSGLISRLYDEVFGMDLPRRVSQMRNSGKLIKRNFQPGDLIFFKINGHISHVGIYVFDNKFFHAASSGPKVGVVKSSLNERYYKERFAYARRLVTLPPWNSSRDSTTEDKIKRENETTTESEKKSIVKRPVSIEIDSQLKGTIDCGSVFFRGQLIGGQSLFHHSKQIYFDIVLQSDKRQELQIRYGRVEGEDYKNVYITADPDKHNYFSMSLTSGIYNIQLLNINGDPVDNTIITVQ